MNTKKHNAFIINHCIPLIRKFFSLTLLVCITETVVSTFYAPTDIVISTGISKTINNEILSNVDFLWLKNAESFNFALEFIICGTLCIEYQFKSPFFSKILMAARLRASPLDLARQILSASSYLASG